MGNSSLDFEDLSAGTVGTALSDSAKEIYALYKKEPRPQISVVIYNARQLQMLVSQIHSYCSAMQEGEKTFEREQEAYGLAMNILNYIEAPMLDPELYQRHPSNLHPGKVYSGDIDDLVKRLEE